MLRAEVVGVSHGEDAISVARSGRPQAEGWPHLFFGAQDGDVAHDVEAQQREGVSLARVVHPLRAVRRGLGDEVGDDVVVGGELPRCDDEAAPDRPLRAARRLHDPDLHDRARVRGEEALGIAAALRIGGAGRGRQCQEGRDARAERPPPGLAALGGPGLAVHGAGPDLSPSRPRRSATTRRVPRSRPGTRHGPAGRSTDRRSCSGLRRRSCSPADRPPRRGSRPRWRARSRGRRGPSSRTPGR